MRKPEMMSVTRKSTATPLRLSRHPWTLPSISWMISMLMRTIRARFTPSCTLRWRSAASSPSTTTEKWRQATKSSFSNTSSSKINRTSSTSWKAKRSKNSNTKRNSISRRSRNCREHSNSSFLALSAASKQIAGATARNASAQMRMTARPSFGWGAAQRITWIRRPPHTSIATRSLCNLRRI